MHNPNPYSFKGRGSMILWRQYKNTCNLKCYVIYWQGFNLMFKCVLILIVFCITIFQKNVEHKYLEFSLNIFSVVLLTFFFFCSFFLLVLGFWICSPLAEFVHKIHDPPAFFIFCSYHWSPAFRQYFCKFLKFRSKFKINWRSALSRNQILI